MKRLWVLMIVILYTIISAETVHADSIGTEIGDKAPDFELTTVDGEQLKLSDFKGKRVMLNFWATWCPPCREEMPAMELFFKDMDAVVLAVNLTDMEVNKKQVTDFINTYGLTFPVLLDEKGEVSSLYRISPIPTTYMIDSQGFIRHKAYGALTYEQMVAEYEQLD